MLDIIVRVIPETLQQSPNIIYELLTRAAHIFKMHVILYAKDMPFVKGKLQELYDKDQHKGPNISKISYKIASKSVPQDLNEVLKTTDEEYILITTGGVHPDKDWSEHMIREVYNPDIIGVSPKIIHRNGDIYYAGILNIKEGKKGIRGFGEVNRADKYTIKTDCVAVVDDFMILKREAFRRVGYFNDSFKKFFYEMEWCARVRKEMRKQLYYVGKEYIIESGKILSFDTQPWQKDLEIYEALKEKELSKSE